MLHEGTTPFLHLDDFGALAIGNDFVLDELDSPSFQIIVEKLKKLPMGELEYPTPDLISEKEIKKLMDEHDLKALISALSDLNFKGSRGVVLKRGAHSLPEFRLEKEIPLPDKEKVELVRKTVADLIRQSLILRAKKEKMNGAYGAPPPEDYYEQQITASTGSLVLPAKTLEKLESIHPPTIGQEATSLVLDFTPIAGALKSVAQLIKGEDIVTHEKVSRWGEAAGIALGLIPFGKLLSKSKKAKELYHAVKGNKYSLSKIKWEEQVEKAAKRREKIVSGKKPGYNFTSTDTAMAYRQNNSMGKLGTFVTDEKQMRSAIGKIDPKKSVIEITPEQAEKLAENLGIPKESTRYGGTLNIIENMHHRAPKVPTGGNTQYRKRGLPGGGPEVTINPLNNTSPERSVRQIELKVRGLTATEKKVRIRKRIELLRQSR